MVRVGSGASEQAITAVIRALNASTTAGTNLAEAAFSARRAFPAPPEQLLRREAMPTRHLGHHGARDQRLFENAGLVVRRPPPPATSTVDDLNAAWRPLRLKRKLKSRRKMGWTARSGVEIATTVAGRLPAKFWSSNGHPAPATSPRLDPRRLHRREALVPRPHIDGARTMNWLRRRLREAVPQSAGEWLFMAAALVLVLVVLMALLAAR